MGSIENIYPSLKACDKGSAAVYGMAQSLPDRSIVDQITRAYLDSLYAIKSLQWSVDICNYNTTYWLPKVLKYFPAK